MKLIVVDVEGGPNGGVFAGEGRMGEFAAILFDKPPFETVFHGKDDSRGTMLLFDEWLDEVARGERVVFVSDNVAFDWQHINWAFHNRLGRNPFGHSARRIGDFWAGLRGNWRDTQGWKKYRKARHDHDPVNDARGNCEALWTILGLQPNADAYTVDKVSGEL